MKKLRVLVIGIIVAALLLTFCAFTWMDHIAKAAIEKGASYALGVTTTLESVDIMPFAGQVELSKLRVANPEGFAAADFLRVDRGAVAVTLGSLMNDQVVLPELVLSGVYVSMERRAGKANYAVLLDHLETVESDSGNAPEDVKSGKHFVIGKLTIRDINVDVELLPVGGALTRMPVLIDEISISDVGTNSIDGVQIAELSGIVLKAILTTVLKRGGNVLPAEIVSDLESGLAGLGGVVIEVLGGVTAGVGEVAEGLGEIGVQVGEKIDEDLKKIGSDLEKTGEEISKGLEDLLGIKKKKKKKGASEDDDG